jgi:septal ring factor EnvC (AmiA/AmiB activator)
VRRASLLLLALVATAHADDDPHAAWQPATPSAKLAPRDNLALQLSAQETAIANAHAIVADKLRGADKAKLARVRAAYRVLHAQVAPDASPDERMNAARRRVAARLLLERDTGERGLLADELGYLDRAASRVHADAGKLPTVALPESILRPARGKIARQFGTLEHEKSHATLSRRGVDIEVEDHVAVVAPADGVVKYAGPIRGLDQGVILDHGTFLTVVAKLGDLTVPVGAPVTAGDRLGRAARHRVYLEVRVKLGPGGLPVDPEPLFAKPR